MKLFPFGWGAKPAKPRGGNARNPRPQPPSFGKAPPSLSQQLQHAHDDWSPGPPPGRFGEPIQPAAYAQYDQYDAPALDDYDRNGRAPSVQGQYQHHELPHAGQNWLTAENIKKSYGTRQVVKGVSLATGRGEAVGLLGPNGAGKTTTFYMITGLVAADEGRITIDGEDVTKLPMYQRARLGVGYLPQEASIFRGLTVEQNIMAVLELVEPKKRKRREQLDNLLEEFSITRLRKSPSLALSGGERRRCEIARALASRPSFMLLDEPFAGIDPLAVGDIQQLVRQLTARGIGVLITDHNVRETLSLVDRAYIIYDGQVLTHGNPQEIINNEDVRRVYLGDMFG